MYIVEYRLLTKMDSKLIIPLLVLTSALGILANYQITGDHWGNEEDSVSSFTAETKDMIKEWENLISDHDAEDIARKYSPGVVWRHPELGLLTSKEDVKKAYDYLFDKGVASVKVTLVNDDYIGDNYAYLLVIKHFRNANGDPILETEDLVILKQLETKGFTVIFEYGY